jgi:protocatechuate 3,4-dioxygenase beta subunit
MPSIDKTIIFFLPQVLATGCRAPVENFTEGAAANAVYASELYQTAVEHANRGDRKAALAALSTALDAGYQTPSSILSSTRFRPLRDEPIMRKALRNVMAKHPRPAVITMVDRDEPGVPLSLELRIVDGEDGQPVEGVVVKIVHVDARGLYQPSDLEAKPLQFNPRLFGYCSTDANGKVSIVSIRPAHYTPQYNAAEPAHVHFTITREGYRQWGGEIFFDDDERVNASVREEARRIGTPIARVVTGTDGVQRATVTLRMQRAH